MKGVAMHVSNEALAYWFFRLNGFLTTVNFVVHSARRGETGTDADILGIRLPYRSELIERPMKDHPAFTGIKGSPYLLVAEVKTSRCALNGPWTDPGRHNVDRVLNAIGILPPEDIDDAARDLYEHGVHKSNRAYVSLACVGLSPSEEINHRYPGVPQFTRNEILSFTFRRFRDYRSVKSWHQTWDEAGQALWDAFVASQDEVTYISALNH